MILLHDYEKIPTEYVSYFQRLQEAIDNSSLSDSLIFTFGKDEQPDDGGSIKIFENGAVRGYIGSIRFEGQTVVIQSRFDSTPSNGACSSRFVSYLLKKLGILPAAFTLSDNTAGASDSDGFEELSAIVFLHMLSDAFSTGIYRQYRDFHRNDSRLKGTLECSRHIQLNPVSNGKAAYHYREYSADNPVNRLIAAVWQILSHNSLALRMARSRSEYRKPLDFLNAEIGWQPLDLHSINNLIHCAGQPVNHPVYHKYEALRVLCLMILERERFQLFKEGVSAPVGLLFNMPKLWEQFLEKILVDEEVDPTSNILLEVHPTSNILLDDTGNCRRRVDPDFIYGNAVLDAKYRADWEQTYKDEVQGKTQNWSNNVRDNIYQVLSYMYLCNKQNGGVIFPMKSRSGKCDPKSFQLTEGKDERKFWLIPFPFPENDANADEASYEKGMNENIDYFKKHMNGESFCSKK